MKAYERLLQYAAVRTPSDETSDTVPSSPCQLALADMLTAQLKELGCPDAHVDAHGYVYGHLAASAGLEQAPALGLIAHMDTVADFCDHDIKPQLHPAYDGNDLTLLANVTADDDTTTLHTLTLSTEAFPHLPSLKGRTLITTDGTTILGADDKAGIAEIMTLLERIQTEQLPHGPLCIGFTPDEEIARGADHFDIESFGATYAYTMDGGPEGEIGYENFNACKAHFAIRGFCVHPGTAKDTMINAGLLAAQITQMLPTAETPRDSEGYEGFYHLTSISGDESAATLDYIVRDFDTASMETRKSTLRHIEKIMNSRWGEGTVALTLTDQYLNMKLQIEPHMQLIHFAKAAWEHAGVIPVINPCRGGTDGARLSFMGLPCPNLGTGGYAFHGPYEHCTVEGMDKTVEMLVELVRLHTS